MAKSRDVHSKEFQKRQLISILQKDRDKIAKMITNNESKATENSAYFYMIHSWTHFVDAFDDVIRYYENEVEQLKRMQSDGSENG